VGDQLEDESLILFLASAMERFSIEAKDKTILCLTTRIHSCKLGRWAPLQLMHSGGEFLRVQSSFSLYLFPPQ